MDTELLQRLDRIERKLGALLGEKAKKKTVWVKASQVMELTGWDRERMRRMRLQGIVEYRKGEKGIGYNLESIPKEFMKQKAATAPTATA